MLLFGILLFFTASAAGRNLDDNILIKLCMQEGIIKSLESQEDNEALTSGCRIFYALDSRFDVGRVSLHLWGRRIESFEEGWYRLNSYTSRVELNINANNIKRLQNGIIDSRNLIMLDLSHNSIHEIESGALNKSEVLENLYLQHNQLTDTEFAATLPPSLEILSLTANAITAISPNSFSKLGKLKTLVLDDNKITTIQQQAFHGLQNLQMLYLSRNPIEKVENGSFVFTPLLNEITISLSGINGFADVGDLLPSLKDIEYVMSHKERLTEH